MIIVEGPDGSGKSTLCRTLGTILAMELFHGGGPPTSPRECLDRIENQFAHRSMIFDRTPLVSERIYGPLIRGCTMLTDSILDQWTKKFIEVGCLLIYCRPTIDRLATNIDVQIEKRDRAYKSIEHIEAVKRKLPKIVHEYDYRIEQLKRKGMTVINHVWN